MKQFARCKESYDCFYRVSKHCKKIAINCAKIVVNFVKEVKFVLFFSMFAKKFCEIICKLQNKQEFLIRAVNWSYRSSYDVYFFVFVLISQK